MDDKCEPHVDLNLLAIFDAIMTEGSLTKAGRRLGKTQSAISHALARLRELTGDRLFERTGSGMRPTPAALSMSANVTKALDLLRSSIRFQGVGFCPKRDSRVFRFDVPGGLDALIASALVSAGVDIDRIQFQISNRRASGIVPDLRAGTTLLAFDLMPSAEPGLNFVTLFDDPFVLVSRKKHPGIRGRINLQKFQALKHVAFNFGGYHDVSPVAERLNQLGITRHEALSTPTLSSIPAVVESSDLVAVLPKRFANHFSAIYKIELHQLAFELPHMPIFMIWHETFDADEAHIWLRSKLQRIFSEL